MTVVLVRIHQYLCTPHFSVCFSLSYRHLLPPAPTRDQTTFGRNSNGCLPRIRKIKRGVCMARAKQKHEISFHLNDLRHIHTYYIHIFNTPSALVYLLSFRLATCSLCLFELNCCSVDEAPLFILRRSFREHSRRALSNQREQYAVYCVTE